MQPVTRTHHEPMPRGCTVKFVFVSRTFFLLADVFYPDDDNVNGPQVNPDVLAYVLVPDDCHACPNPLDHIAQELRKTVTTTQEVLEFVPDAQDVAKFVPDALEVAKLIAAVPEVAKLIAAALEVAEVVPAAPEVNEVIPAVQEVAQTDVLIIKALATNPSDEGGLWIQVLILVPLSIYQPKKANNNKSMN